MTSDGTLFDGVFSFYVLRHIPGGWRQAVAETARVLHLKHYERGRGVLVRLMGHCAAVARKVQLAVHWEGGWRCVLCGHSSLQR